MLPREQFVSEMPIFNKADLLAQLEEQGVELYGSQKIVSISPEGVTCADAVTGEQRLFAGESVVNALGVKPDNKLGLGCWPSTAAIRSFWWATAAKGGNYYRANHEAYDAAMRI